MKHLWGTLAALALLTGCTPSPAPAPSPDPDAVFRAAIKDRFPGDLAKAPAMGHSICDDFKAGTGFAAEVTYLRTLAPALTAGDAGYLIGAATSNYCPEYQNRH